VKSTIHKKYLDIINPNSRIMAQIFDLHCHPGMKYFMRIDQEFYLPHYPTGGIIGYCYPLAIYYDALGVKAGGVKVIFNVHYIPENGFHKSELINILSKIDIDTDRIVEDQDQFNGTTHQMEQNDSAWLKLNDSLDHTESLIFAANQNSATTGVRIAIVKSPQDFDTAIANNDLVVISAIEGAHHLGRNLGSTEQPYIERLKILKQKGIFAFTLSHFFINDICDSAGGIPPGDAKTINYRTPAPLPNGLTPIGEKVVDFALNNGFLIDLVHSTQKARQRVYAINNNRYPLAFTHTGLANFYTGKDALPENIPYLASDTDIDAIAACKGILGIILMRYWLCAIDDDSACDDAILASIHYIIKRTGCDDYVGIGTDLDGFTHVPDNLRQSAKLSHLSDIITSEFGSVTAQKILYGNALRVLKTAWK